MEGQHKVIVARPGLVISAIALVFMIAVRTEVGAQESGEKLTIALNEYQNSGVSGWASLTPKDDGVQVTMAVEGKAVRGNHPSHVHTGTCADFDPNPLYPLTTVILDPLSDDGASKTTVEDVSLDELLDDDYVILIHKSAEELTNYFVCGDIKESNTFTGPTTAGSMVPPDAGVGAAYSAVPSRAPFFTAVGALTLTLLAASLPLWRGRVQRG